MQLILGAGGIAIAVVVIAVAVGLQLEERAVIRTSLRRLEGYDIQDTRDKDLLEPLRARTLSPAFKSLVEFGRSVTPVGYYDRVRKKLIKAGMPSSETLDRFLVAKGVCIVGIVPALYVVWFVADLRGMLAWVVSGFAVMLLVLGPDSILNRRVDDRVYKMRIALPEILDLLVISVEAGLGFEQALDRVVEAVPGPLTDEFVRMLGEIRAGSSRSDALRSMEQRVDVPEIRSFIMTMLQADSFGISIGRVLRQQADEMRLRRRQIAQEMAQKAPVKMLIPMVFCIFPALFVVVLGPAVLDIMDAF